MNAIYIALVAVYFQLCSSSSLSSILAGEGTIAEKLDRYHKEFSLKFLGAPEEHQPVLRTDEECRQLARTFVDEIIYGEIASAVSEGLVTWDDIAGYLFPLLRPTLPKFTPEEFWSLAVECPGARSKIEDLVYHSLVLEDGRSEEFETAFDELQTMLHDIKMDRLMESFRQPLSRPAYEGLSGTTPAERITSYLNVLQKALDVVFPSHPPGSDELLLKWATFVADYIYFTDFSHWQAQGWISWSDFHAVHGKQYFPGAQVDPETLWPLIGGKGRDLFKWLLALYLDGYGERAEYRRESEAFLSMLYALTD